MAYQQGVMRPPPSRLTSQDQAPPPAAEQVPVPPPPENTWPCGCTYPGTHSPDCMWSLWEQMKDNYNQTKSLMSKFMGQVDGMQTGAKGQGECQCPPGCHGKDLGAAMGLQQMQGVTVPWLQPPGATPSQGVAVGVAGEQTDAGRYQSESRQIIEEQQRVKQTWAQFLNIFDMALDLANDVSRDRREAARLRRERERIERQERREEERRQRQERREKCAEERSKSKDEEDETEKLKDGRKEERKSSMKPEKENKQESRKSDAKPPPSTPQRMSSRKSTQREVEEKKTEEENAEPEQTPESGPAETEEEAAEEGAAPQEEQTTEP